MRFKMLGVAALAISTLPAAAQDSTTALLPLPGNYSFVHPDLNIISNAAALEPLFAKLRILQAKHQGVVRIVHIGDSHTQADMMTGPVRRQIQAFFGNAGRGLVFPYTVAKSNPPVDVKSSSNKTWQANRLAHPEIPVACGVAGFGIHNSNRDAYVDLSIADTETDNSFDLVTVYGDSKDVDSICYSVSPQGGVAIPQWLRKGNKTGALTYKLPARTTGIRIQSCSGTGAGNFSLYGVGLQKSATAGVLYNVIGVNGATYEEYATTPLFWKGLPGLEADCYIISMGTNEAQATFLKRDSFLSAVRAMVHKLREASPKAVILLSTPAGSYTHGGVPNSVLGDVRNALVSFCVEEKLAFWDLYTATSGYQGARRWKAAGLMAKDDIHYNKSGYTLQGLLFYRALQQAYLTSKGGKGR